MTWDVFSMIGTVAFAISGAIVAMEEEYDVFGVFVLALVTAFGGGLARNLMIGLPVSAIWNQGMLFTVAIITTAVVFVLPLRFIHHWLRVGNIFDALGLSTFAIQGALYAADMKYTLGAVIAAAVMTGIGGGVIRDMLAKRKPMVLHDEIYAMWAVVAGVVIGLHWINPYSAWQLYTLLVLLFGLRILSIAFKWRIPRRTLRMSGENQRDWNL